MSQPPRTNTVQPRQPERSLTPKNLGAQKKLRAKNFNHSTANIAWAKQGDKLVHISMTKRGVKTEYTCLYCGRPLIAKIGPERSHHFAHKNQSTICDIHSEATKKKYETRLRAIENLVNTLRFLSSEPTTNSSVSLLETCPLRHSNPSEHREYSLPTINIEIEPREVAGRWSILIRESDHQIISELQIGGKLSATPTANHPVFLISILDASSWNGFEPLPAQYSNPSTCSSCHILRQSNSKADYFITSPQSTSQDRSDPHLDLASFVILWEGILTIKLPAEENFRDLRILIGDDIGEDDLPHRRVLTVDDRIFAETIELSDLFEFNSLSNARARLVRSLNDIINSMKRNAIHHSGRVRFVHQLNDDAKDVHLLRIMKARLTNTQAPPHLEKNLSDVLWAINYLRFTRASELAHPNKPYKKLATIYHPDKGGSEEDMKSLNRGKSLIQDNLSSIDPLLAEIKPLVYGHNK